MIRTMALYHDQAFTTSLSVEDIKQQEDQLRWYWIDFSAPTISETASIEACQFHPLAVEDCLRFLQKPKLDYYDDYHFLVVHALHPETLQAEEVDVFASPQFLVTFHYQDRPEINEIWQRLLNNPTPCTQSPYFVLYKLIDKIVDFIFPITQKIQDRLSLTEHHLNRSSSSMNQKMRAIYEIRSELLSLRQLIIPMQDMVYRLLNSQRIGLSIEEQRYYSDVHDHLEKLVSMVRSSREITSDLHEHTISMNSHRMNTVMMTLTVITTIFMPLTFIAGVYGMNFQHMPELEWKYSYFFILGIMGIIGSGLYLFFKQKGWFDSF